MVCITWFMVLGYAHYYLVTGLQVQLPRGDFRSPDHGFEDRTPRTARGHHWLHLVAVASILSFPIHKSWGSPLLQYGTVSSRPMVSKQLLSETIGLWTNDAMIDKNSSNDCRIKRILKKQSTIRPGFSIQRTEMDMWTI